MGVFAVDVVRPAIAFRENQLHAGDDRHRHPRTSFSSHTILHRKLRRPFKLQAAPASPSSLSKPRHLHARRGLTPLAAASTKCPSSISISEPAAAQLLYCSLDLAAQSSSSLPAPASGAQPYDLRPVGRRMPAGFDDVVEDDRILDYKEAAAVLEQLFSESPSLENDCISEDSSDDAGSASASQLAKTTTGRPDSRLAGVTTKRRRKDLMARITLRRKRMGLEKGDAAHTSKRLGAVGEMLSGSIWSEAASKLLRQHGSVVNLMAQNWSRLSKELLSAEEERWLALLMKPAKALQKVRAKLRHQIGREVIQEEWAQAANMDVPTLSRHLALHHAARNKLVKLNLRLVRHQAHKYERDASVSSLTAVDLCQEGIKGLIVATDRFDPSKGVRFSSYAIFWIRNSILRAQTRSGYPIRAPFNFAEIKMNVNKAKWEMRLEGEEVADGKASASVMKRILERAGVDEDRYKVVLQSNRRVVSLHKRDPTSGDELIERLADPNSHRDTTFGYLVGHGASDPSLRLGIDDVLDSLKPKESLVLRQRFGLDGKGERALGEIGRNMRMSREMVRRYEVRGLLKLKHPTRLDYLRSFLSPNP